MGNSFQNWGKLKPRHRKFMDTILNAPIHIIATARGKDEWVMEDKGGKQVPKKVGLGAQQDKDVTYEYTVSFMIEQDTHIASPDKDNTHLFEGRYEVLTEKDGEKLYDWANDSDIPATVKKMPPKVDEDRNEEIKTIIQTKFTELEGDSKKAFKVLMDEVGIKNFKDVSEVPTADLERLVEFFNE